MTIINFYIVYIFILAGETDLWSREEIWMDAVSGTNSNSCAWQQKFVPSHTLAAELRISLSPF